MSPRVLVVDDERNIRRVLQALLEGDGYDVDAAADGDEARQLLRRRQPGYDVVLTDLRMPGTDGLDLLRWVGEHQPDTPVVMLTAHGSVDVAVEAMRHGAFDFLTKPFDEVELQDVVGKAVARREANGQRAYAVADDAPAPDATDALGRIVGRSAPMQALFSTLQKVAPSPTTVLVRGESGTGKELVAQALHRLSPRRGGPFVAVNCAAIPETLFESELFGHEKGAFTGAHRARPGRFELADGGTLFLDEIGELPAAMQVKLLRVLQERSIERVGGDRAVPLDVRVVAATNADLDAAVQAGTFREDLYYRLAVVPLTLPPLRERPGDVPVLARHFLERFAARLERAAPRLAPAAEDALTSYAWPGNIRQLENLMERLALLVDGAEVTPDDLPAEVRGGASPPRDAEEPLPGVGLKEFVRVKTAQIEREMILRALEQDDWNVTHAARRLGLSRKVLQLKMKDYQLRQEGG